MKASRIVACLAPRLAELQIVGRAQALGLCMPSTCNVYWRIRQLRARERLLAALEVKCEFRGTQSVFLRVRRF
jgi:hypothetical protein